MPWLVHSLVGLYKWNWESTHSTIVALMSWRFKHMYAAHFIRHPALSNLARHPLFSWHTHTHTYIYINLKFVNLLNLLGAISLSKTLVGRGSVFINVCCNANICFVSMTGVEQNKLARNDADLFNHLSFDLKREALLGHCFNQPVQCLIIDQLVDQWWGNLTF